METHSLPLYYYPCFFCVLILVLRKPPKTLHQRVDRPITLNTLENFQTENSILLDQLPHTRIRFARVEVSNRRSVTHAQSELTSEGLGEPAWAPCQIVCRAVRQIAIKMDRSIRSIRIRVGYERNRNQSSNSSSNLDAVTHQTNLQTTISSNWSCRQDMIGFVVHHQSIITDRVSWKLRNDSPFSHRKLLDQLCQDFSQKLFLKRVT